MYFLSSEGDMQMFRVMIVFCVTTRIGWNALMWNQRCDILFSEFWWLEGHNMLHFSIKLSAKIIRPLKLLSQHSGAFLFLVACYNSQESQTERKLVNKTKHNEHFCLSHIDWFWSGKVVDKTNLSDLKKTHQNRLHLFFHDPRFVQNRSSISKARCSSLGQEVRFFGLRCRKSPLYCIPSSNWPLAVLDAVFSHS